MESQNHGCIPVVFKGPMTWFGLFVLIYKVISINFYKVINVIVLRIRLANSCRTVYNFRQENAKPNKKDISEMTSAGDHNDVLQRVFYDCYKLRILRQTSVT